MPVVPQGEYAQKLFHARLQDAPRQPPQAPDQLQILAPGEVRIDVRFFRNVADAPLKSNEVLPDVRAVEKDIAVARLDEAGQNFYSCALTGSVRTQVAENLPGAYDEAHVIHHGHAVIPLHQPAHFQHLEPLDTGSARIVPGGLAVFYSRCGNLLLKHSGNRVGLARDHAVPGFVDTHVVLVQNLAERLLQVRAGALQLVQRVHFAQAPCGIVTLRNHHIENRRGPEFVFAARAGQGLILQLARNHARIVRRARIPQRGPVIHDIQLDIVVKLLVLNLLLAIVQLVGDFVRLRRPVANRYRHLKGYAVIRKVSREDLPQNAAVTADQCAAHLRRGQRIRQEGVPERSQRAGLPGIREAGGYAEARPQIVLRAEQVQAGILQCDLVLLDLRPVRDGFGDQILNGNHGLYCRDVDVIRGNHASDRDAGVIEAAARDYA